MAAYQITGNSGSGKTTIGGILGERGYRVIDADSLSYWVTTETGAKAIEPPRPPYSSEWLRMHKWVWDAVKMQRLLTETDSDPVFFVGGSHNASDFRDAFALRFALYVDDATMIRRLQAREPDRWAEGSPELMMRLGRNRQILEFNVEAGAIIIDSTLSPEHVADAILSHVRQ